MEDDSLLLLDAVAKYQTQEWDVCPVGIDGGNGFLPTKILHEVFGICPYDWDVVLPCCKEPTPKGYVWWFSVFEDFEGDWITFYYPKDVQEGEKVEVVVTQSCSISRTSIYWTHGMPGLVLGECVPLIWLFLKRSEEVGIQLQRSPTALNSIKFSLQ